MLRTERARTAYHAWRVRGCPRAGTVLQVRGARGRVPNSKFPGRGDAGTRGVWERTGPVRCTEPATGVTAGAEEYGMGNRRTLFTAWSVALSVMVLAVNLAGCAALPPNSFIDPTKVGVSAGMVMPRRAGFGVCSVRVKRRPGWRVRRNPRRTISW